MASAERSPGLAATGYGDHGTAEASVSSLYQASALSLIRLAYVMLGDLPSAEDVVQEAFVGLYRRKVSQQLVAFSTATGKVRQVLSDVTFLDADDEQVQWTTPSGSKLIVTDTRPAHAAHTPFYEANAGVQSGGHYAPLPWSARTFAAAW